MDITKHERYSRAGGSDPAIVKRERSFCHDPGEHRVVGSKLLEWNSGVSEAAPHSPLVYESGALTLQFTARRRQLPLVEA